MDVIGKLQQAQKLKEEILQYFGYEETWKSYELDDSTEYFWFIDDEEIFFCPNKKFNPSETYSAYIVSSYEKSDFTMIVNDTGCDGNSFASIFDNIKKVPRRDL